MATKNTYNVSVTFRNEQVKVVTVQATSPDHAITRAKMHKSIHSTRLNPIAHCVVTSAK